MNLHRIRTAAGKSAIFWRRQSPPDPTPTARPPPPDPTCRARPISRPADTSDIDATSGRIAATEGVPAWTFLKNFVRNPTAVGAITPSSQGLVETMVEWFDWETARNVLEYGPGTGVFTQGIQKRLHADAKFFAIERSPDLAQITRDRCPGMIVHEESAADVARLCRDASMDRVDAIICGLPWASFPESLQRSILDATLDVLKPGGQFATFAYWQGVVLPAGLRFSKRLRESFSDVHRSPTVWRNLPPAFVYRCTK